MATGLCLALVSCSQSGSSEDTYEPLSMEDFDERIAAAMTDVKTAHASLTRTLTSKEMTTKGDIQIGQSSGNTKVSMTGEAFSFPLDIRKIDDQTYIKLGRMTQDKFVIVDDAEKATGMEEPLSNTINATDPSQLVTDFGNAVTSFDEQGDAEKLDGVKTHAYKLGVETDKISAISETTRRGMPDSLSFTLQVGTDDLPRRISLSEKPVKFTTDFTDWGAQVNIEKPEKSMVSKSALPGP